MKVLTRMIATFLISVGFATAISAQRRFDRLDQASDAVERIVSTAMPEWHHHAIPPAMRNDNTSYAVTSGKVSIKQWEFGKRTVRVALVYHNTDADASSALKKFVSDKKTSKVLPGTGDEAYVWGLGDSVAMRVGNVTIFIDAIVTKDDDPLADNKKESEARHTAHEEEKLLAKGFTNHVVRALRINN